MKRLVLIFFSVIALAMSSREVSAFWGSDTKENSSGLNVATGFDANTITTITGRVMSLPEPKDQEQHAVMTVAAVQGAVTVVLGPWWYWEKQAIIITKNQDMVITGSLAQGKDGALYVFAQYLENQSTGESVILRSESGKPLWSGSGSGAGMKSGTRQYNGGSQRYGAGNRGAGARGGRR